MSPSKVYRPAMVIFFQILEQLIKKGKDGLIKSQIYKDLSLRTGIGEKYLAKLEKGGYIQIHQEDYGDSRIRYRVLITELGIQRFHWFINITTELDLKEEKNAP